MTDTTSGHGCGSCSTTSAKGFNFCYWGKLLVAIPALTVIGFICASYFESPVLQMLVGPGSAVLAAYVALKLDEMPALSGMITRDKT